MSTSETPQSNRFLLPALFAASLLIWCYCFRGFLTGQVMFSSDAVSYYDHIKFYIQSLAQGVYPLWDPYWNGGVANEFFLRRMGSFNPFLFIILIFYKLGVPYLFSYLIFLAIYWLIGGLGFYNLLMRILNNRAASFFGFLIFYFSVIGTRLFDSYINFVIIPTVWFFYFLIGFCQKPSKFHALGIVFTLMVLLTTYIPLYFVIMIVSFVFFFGLVYFTALASIGQRIVRFIFHHKIFICFCLIAVSLSCIPGIQMYRAAQGQNFVLPQRSFKVQSADAMEVDKTVITNWAILEEFVFAGANADYRRFKFAVIYFPAFGLIVFLIGLMARVNRRMLFLLLWLLFLFLLGAPGLTPVYDLLYEHVPFFKIFRNLHWFLWVAILPGFVVYLAELFAQILEWPKNEKIRRNWFIGYVVLVHAVFAAFWFLHSPMILSTWVTIALSLAFFILYANGYWENKKNRLLISILLVSVIQPLQVFGYLNQNYLAEKFPYQYDQIDLNFRFQEGKAALLNQKPAKEDLYYATAGYNLLTNSLHPNIWNNYKRNKLIVYDHLEFMDENNIEVQKLSLAFLNQLNVAFVPKEALTFKTASSMPRSHIIEQDSDEVKLLAFNANGIKVQTNFKTPKFLVYNDSFDKKWQAYINKKKTDIVRANIAFKGLWVPAGEHTVDFRYGSGSLYSFTCSLLILFLWVLGYLVVLGFKENRL